MQTYNSQRSWQGDLISLYNDDLNRTYELFLSNFQIIIKRKTNTIYYTYKTISNYTANYVSKKILRIYTIIGVCVPINEIWVPLNPTYTADKPKDKPIKWRHFPGEKLIKGAYLEIGFPGDPRFIQIKLL